MSKAWAGGSTARWRTIRRRVLDRDGHRCRLNLDGCTIRADQVHHTVAREVAGDNPAHLVAACRACNLKIGDPRRHDPQPQPRTRW